MNAATEVRRHPKLLALVAVLGLVALLSPIGNDSAGAGSLSCSAPFLIDETLPHGGRWQMCWERRNLEGIVFHDITFTPPGGDPIEVMDQANLSQVHVPYDDNGARFHDESDFGLGYDAHLNDLAAGDCPGGTLLQVPGSDPESPNKHVLCQQVANSGYAYKDYDTQQQVETLSLFSVSHIGAYNYVNAWNFDGDGTIRPEMGATGTLQRYGGTSATGWNVGNPFGFAVAHMHNFYWRLDFDLGGTAANDRVQELAATPNGSRESLNNTRTPFGTEVERKVMPRSMRTWRIRDTQITNDDGHSISYELIPNTDFVFNGPTYEPWTQNEFYATRYHPCERFASHNPTSGGCPSNLHGFVNGESLAPDVVVYYGTSFHHLPRDEDEAHMDAHWSGFTIQPRDLTAEYPIP